MTWVETDEKDGNKIYTRMGDDGNMQHMLVLKDMSGRPLTMDDILGRNRFNFPEVNDPRTVADLMEICVNGKECAAVDAIYDCIDNNLGDGRFKKVDDMLLEFELPKLTTTLKISLLSITLGAKDKLPNRKVLYDRIHEMFLIEHPDRWYRLLKGLEQ